MTDPAGDINHVLASIPLSAAGLRFARLEPGEQHALGNYLFTEAPCLVGRVSDALLEHPALFAHAPIGGAKLMEKQARAGAWLALHGYLMDLSAAALQSYQKEQGDACRLSMQILRSAKDELACAPHREDARARAQALRHAFSFLYRYRKATLSRRKERRRSSAP